MINRARSAAETGRRANRFRNEGFGAGYCFCESQATGEECSNSGRISASSAMRVPRLNTRSAILRENAIAKQKIERFAVEMPALDQNRLRPEFRNALCGCHHLRPGCDAHTS